MLVHEGGIVIRFDTIDAVSREVARRVLEKIADGSKPVSSWKCLWICGKSAMRNEKRNCRPGTQGLQLVGLKPRPTLKSSTCRPAVFPNLLHPKSWLHSVEAAQLAGLIASELHLDVELARRATLLHDIGKRLRTKEARMPSSAAVAAQYEEPPEVVNAIGAHHARRTTSMSTHPSSWRPSHERRPPGARRNRWKPISIALPIWSMRRVRSRASRSLCRAGRARTARAWIAARDDTRTLAMAAEIAAKYPRMSRSWTNQGNVIRTFTAQETAR